MNDVLTISQDDGFATVTLQRPGARNALSSELLHSLMQAMENLDADETVQAIILTGADPAFCAGLDLKELGSGSATAPFPNFAREDGTAGPIPAMHTPVIGAINGVAITGGLELALACDFLIASEHARFADTHARVGIQPGWGLTVLLPEAVGLRRARQMSATGNFIDAATALHWGLVNQVVPHHDLLPVARAVATDIASNDGPAVQRIFATYNENQLVDGHAAWRNEAHIVAEWNSGRFNPTEIEKRRGAVAQRGRTQV